MSAADRAVWFVGDLDDPWVAALAEALPIGSRRMPCAGGLPDDWPDELAASRVAPAPVLVLHRALLTAFDAERLGRLRIRRTPPLRVVLCFGPHVRHADLDQWSARGLIDALVPEATARDTIARHLAPGAWETLAPDRRAAGRRVALISSNVELQRTLAEACEALGYTPEPAADWAGAGAAAAAASSGPALWDVPVLEPDWTRFLARRSRLGPVVALLGFADRSLVTQARGHGASACLELPYDLLDLGHVLDRLTASRTEPGHLLPPSPVGMMAAAAGDGAGTRRRAAPTVAGAGPDA
jgi:hypothetical protein